MEQNYEDDTFLGRWIEGDLSEEERVAFEKTDIHKQYMIINREAQLLEGPEIDTEAALLKVSQKIKSPEKVFRLKPYWFLAAAVVLLLISFGIFNSSKTYSTQNGEQLIVNLEDGSSIQLSANTTLSHKRFFWSSNKEVNISGEAYFTITKGDDFKVQTSQGTIAVLGTEFNINDRKNLFEIKCYEGKVQFTVANKSDSFILTKGKSVRLINQKIIPENFEETKPNWLTSTSVFKDQPFHKVIAELSLYYDVSFNTDAINTDRIYSGSFTHTDLKTALETTLTPMGITYKISENKKMITLAE